ncbi:MAG: hypothetical protein ACFE9I_01210 [Candidatus Hermodarchaeota archaeon]
MKMEREEIRKGKLAINVIAGILALIGFIFLFIMISDMVEFTEYIDYLESIYGYYMDDPRVQQAIAEGYWTLAKDKLIIFVPLLIGAVVVKVAGNKALERNLMVSEATKTIE